MGMDLSIYAAPNHEVFNHDGWWESDSVEEKYYARRYWDLVNHCSFLDNYTPGDFYRLEKEDIEELVKIACEYRNYWYTYDDVSKLCELRDEYDSIIESGKHLYLEYNY